MTNKTKKILSILASTAVLAGFTADIALNSNPTTVSAAKNHKKKKTSKKSKLNADGTDSPSKYSSLGAWYAKNQKVLDNYYNNASSGVETYRSARQSAYSLTLDPKYYNNPVYKYGFILDLANDSGKPFYTGGAGTAKYFNKIIEIYKSAGKYINDNHPNDYISLNPTTLQWSQNTN